MHNVRTHSVDIEGKALTFESGRMAHQAHGACLVTHGDTAILATTTMGENPREGVDFFPLLVDFEAKFYAKGKMKGSRFLKREGRASDSATLIARMIDRPMRPLFPKGMKNDVQIVVTLLQTDGERSVAPTAINAASMSTLLSGVPFETAVGGVRVGRKSDGSFFLDPSFDEVEEGGLDLVVAGTEETVLMIEAGANLIEPELLLEALEYAHKHIKTICAAQKEFLAQHAPTPLVPSLRSIALEVEQAVDAEITESDLNGIGGTLKKEIKSKIHALEDRLAERYATEIEEGTLSKGELFQILDKRFAANMRQRVFTTGKRIDGRGIDDVRPVSCEVGLFPRVHGSALFHRGETQALSMLTIGGPSDAQILDDPDREETTVEYMHHYNFPAYSVGEVRPMRGPGRREIGHGALAERALRPVVPSKKDDNYPYVLRVVSEILTCNGSSSMASVCGSTLSLMDGGVPIKCPIAGIAMGLMMNAETGDYKVLTDIQSFEDFDGDMDFKVTGDATRITALQLDMKLKGLPMDVLRDAMKKAEAGRRYILEQMNKAIDAPRVDMSNYAPRVDSFKIPVDFIRVVIGKGGETIQGLQEKYKVDISIEDDGTIFITGVDQEGAKAARRDIDLLTYEPKVGDVFEDAEVKNIMDFGAFVEYAPSKEALVHISEMADKRIDKVEDVLKLGQKVKVKIIGIDKMGRVQLSMKQA